MCFLMLPILFSSRPFNINNLSSFSFHPSFITFPDSLLWLLLKWFGSFPGYNILPSILHTLRQHTAAACMRLWFLCILALFALGRNIKWKVEEHRAINCHKTTAGVVVGKYLMSFRTLKCIAMENSTLLYLTLLRYISFHQDVYFIYCNFYCHQYQD